MTWCWNLASKDYEPRHRIISSTYSLIIRKCWCFWSTIMCRQKSNLFLFFMTKGCDNRWNFFRQILRYVFLLCSVYLSVSYVQALSSYVFIAANVILHSRQSVQIYLLNQLLPPILPFLTSHHHSLRGFTQVITCNLKFCWNIETEDPFFMQLLVHLVLSRLWPTLHLETSEGAVFERSCFQELKDYLAENSDCVR